MPDRKTAGLFIAISEIIRTFAVAFYTRFNMYLGIRIRKVAWLLPVVVSVLFLAPDVAAQRMALKTNALDYFTLSPNLTLEARLSRRVSLQLGVATNPLSLSVADIKTTNFRVEPEVRYWFNRPMARHFVAVSATAGVCSLRFRERYFSGDAVAMGVSYGYALVLGPHWNMEAEIGVGLASVRGYYYKGAKNKPIDINFSRILPVPVRFGLSFAYIFK